MFEKFKHLSLKNGTIGELKMFLEYMIWFGSASFIGRVGDERLAAKSMSQDLMNHQKV